MGRCENIQAVLERAASCPAGEIAGLLDRECGSDAALRGEVESLLQSLAGAGRFLAAPTADSSSAAGERANTLAAPLVTEPGPAVGTRVGPYTLLERIGEGGFGTVYLAEQDQPVRRRVALKIIKPGMDTRQVIARFEAERQALAMMDHPHIARVLDGGEHRLETGATLPYFVMELVGGVPITRHCNEHTLTIRERLALFTDVCHAVQHAHQKGIIHRDLKPSNILVTGGDLGTGNREEGTETIHSAKPKIIDFGIAKAVAGAGPLTDKTLITEARQLIGTPAYMSPEQAGLSDLDIDTRSDIYSLGVLLYELLTGTTPFDPKALLSAGHDELRRIIREVDPPKPSTRVSSLLTEKGSAGVSPRDDSSSRSLDPSIPRSRAPSSGSLDPLIPRSLVRTLRGDLDWIVMKCLEKDRTRRYETAIGLAADIKRHLNDEPVTAGAPSTGYKLRKFVKRNRAQVIAGGVVAGALVLGVVGTTGGMIWALSEKSKATLAAESEAKARKRAETINEFVTTALRASDAELAGREGGTEGAGRDMTILEAMDNAIADINSGRFKDDSETEAALRDTIGVILRNNGTYDKAEPLLKQALAIRERLFKGDDPIVATSLTNLAWLYSDQSQSGEAEPLYTRALAIREKALGPDDPLVAASLHNLAVFYRYQGQYAQAEPLFARALAIYEKFLGPDDPDVANTLNSLAVCHKTQGQYAQAEPLYTRALAIREKALGPDHPLVAQSLSNLANLYFDPDQYAQAEPLFRRALAIREKAYGPDHPEVANSLNNLAGLYQNQGQHIQAEPLFSRALAIWETALGLDHPNVLISKGNLAALYWKQGKLDKSVPLFEAVLQAQEAKLGRQHPGTLNTVGNLGVNYKDAGRLTEAIPLLEEAHRASKQYPQLAFAGRALASLYRAQGHFAKAEPFYTETLAITEKALGPDHSEALKAKSNLASLYWSQGKLDKSVPMFEEVLKGREAKLGRQHQETLTTVGNLGVNYLDAGRLTEAIALLEEAYRASKQYPRLGFAGPALLAAYTKAADPAKPESNARVEVLMGEMLAAARGTLPRDSPELAAQLASVGQSLLTQKAWDGAEPLIREALTIREAKAPEDWTTFHTSSLLGGALLGQNKLAEAEPLLLDGYRGMKEREAAIPAQGKMRIPEALERLVRLYEATDNEPEAAAWRSKLEAALAEQGKPDGKGGGG